MDISITKNKDGSVIELSGKLIGNDIMQKMNETLHGFLIEGIKNVIIDLKDVSMMTSTGMGVLISSYTTMRNGDGMLKLANVTDRVQGLLQMTNLDKIFEFYPSTQKALDSFK